MHPFGKPWTWLVALATLFTSCAGMDGPFLPLGPGVIGPDSCKKARLSCRESRKLDQISAFRLELLAEDYRGGFPTGVSPWPPGPNDPPEHYWGSYLVDFEGAAAMQVAQASGGGPLMAIEHSDTALVFQGEYELSVHPDPIQTERGPLVQGRVNAAFHDRLFFFSDSPPGTDIAVDCLVTPDAPEWTFEDRPGVCEDLSAEHQARPWPGVEADVNGDWMAADQAFCVKLQHVLSSVKARACRPTSSGGASECAEQPYGYVLSNQILNFQLFGAYYVMTADGPDRLGCATGDAVECPPLERMSGACDESTVFP